MLKIGDVVRAKSDRQAYIDKDEHTVTGVNGTDPQWISLDNDPVEYSAEAFELVRVAARGPAVGSGTQALRFNAGKAELFYPDLFPAAMEGVAKSMMYGCRRAKNPYPPFNWRKGAPYLELYDAARRHMMKWLNGEELDPDALANGFEINHLDFAIGNLQRLRQQIADAAAKVPGAEGWDDRPGAKYAADERLEVPRTVSQPDSGGGGGTAGGDAPRGSNGRVVRADEAAPPGDRRGSIAA